MERDLWRLCDPDRQDKSIPRKLTVNSPSPAGNSQIVLRLFPVPPREWPHTTSRAIGKRQVGRDILNPPSPNDLTYSHPLQKQARNLVSLQGQKLYNPTWQDDPLCPTLSHPHTVKI